MKTNETINEPTWEERESLARLHNEAVSAAETAAAVSRFDAAMRRAGRVVAGVAAGNGTDEAARRGIERLYDRCNDSEICGDPAVFECCYESVRALHHAWVAACDAGRDVRRAVREAECRMLREQIREENHQRRMLVGA